MTRYITVKNSEILQILKKKPLFVPEGAQILTYEGPEPDESLRFIDGKIIAIVEQSIPIPISVEKYQKEKIKEIEEKINNIRLQYVNEMSIQTEVYLEKTQQAIDFLVNPQQDVNNFPLLSVEIEVTGKPAIEVATNIIEKRKQWLSFLTKTEKIRLIAKRDIVKCRTKKDVDVIFKQLIDSLVK